MNAVIRHKPIPRPRGIAGGSWAAVRTAPAADLPRIGTGTAWRQGILGNLSEAVSQYSALSADDVLKRLTSHDPRTHEIVFEHARITGSLDLRGLNTASAVRFSDCLFECAPDLSEATLKSLTLDDCLVPAFVANSARISGSLSLTRCFVPFGLKAKGAQMAAALDLRGSVICCPFLLRDAFSDVQDVGGTRRSVLVCLAALAISAVGREDGEIASMLSAVTAIDSSRRHLRTRREQERLLAKFFENWTTALGPIDVAISNLKEKSIDISNLKAEQDVNCGLLERDGKEFPFYSLGRFSMPGAQVRGVLRFTGAKLANGWRAGKSGRPIALKLDGSTIDGSVEFINGRVQSAHREHLLIPFESYGTVRMYSVKILGALDCRGAKFHCCDARPATDTTERSSERYSEKELATREMAKASAAVTLYNSSIGGIFDLRGPRDNPNAPGPLPKERFGVLKGYLNLRDSKAGRIMDNPNHWPPKGFLILEGFAYDGFSESITSVEEVDVPRKIFSLVPTLCYLVGAAVLLFLSPVAGMAPFALWLLLMTVRGFSFIYSIPSRLAPFRPSRSHWLELQPQWHLHGHDRSKHDANGSLPHEGFRPQPFEHLEKVLRESGAEDDSRQIGILKHVYILKNTHHLVSREYKRILGMLVQFGYSPWRPAHIVLLLIAMSSIVFDAAYRAEVISVHDDEMRAAMTAKSGTVEARIKKYPSFNAFVYSIETILPIVELGQTGYWAPLAEPEPETPSGAIRQVCSVHLRPQGLEEWLSSSGPRTAQIFEGWEVSLPYCATREHLQALVWINGSLGWLLTSVFVAGLAGIMKR